MALLLLPSEIQDMIFEFVLEPSEDFDHDKALRGAIDKDLRGAIVASWVCKAFQRRFERLISALPLKRFSRVLHRGDLRRIPRFIECRTPCSSSRPDARQDLNTFVERVLERFLQPEFIPDSTEYDTLRAIYKSRLVYVLSMTSGERCEALVRTHYDHRFYLTTELYHPEIYIWSKDADVELQSYATGTTLEDQDMLIAAVAVGNQLAFTHFVDRVSDLQKQGKVFRSVWSAAVFADRNEVLEYLISRLPSFPVFMNPLSIHSGGAGAEMILPVWEALWFTCSHAKVAAGKMLMDILSKGDLLQDLEMEHDETLSSRCMKADCVPLLKHLLMHLSHVEEKALYPHLMASFVFRACLNGRLNVMRYLLERQYVSPNKKQLDVDGNFRDTDRDSEIGCDENDTYWDEIDEPLVAAAKGCHIEAMKLLLKHGAKIPKPSKLLREVIYCGIAGYRFNTANFLLETGIIILDGEACCTIAGFAIGIDFQHRNGKVTADAAMTLISLTSASIRIPGYHAAWDDKGLNAMHKIVQGVLDNGPELPRAPVDFVELAKECLKWYPQNGRNDVNWI